MKNTTYTWRRRLGWCPECMTPTSHYYCKACRAKHSARAAAKYREKQAVSAAHLAQTPAIDATYSNDDH